ncbi:MAG: hypothetical protein LBU70_01500 [Chitinispirillales bacterium]|jgi:hypothetical protein|nr:hypothetical protein [Chitinispirillales bacterium]
MIHYNIPEPKLSHDFTIEDIHKIRYWNYERMKDATIEERMKDSQKRANAVLKRMGLTNFERIAANKISY